MSPREGVSVCWLDGLVSGERVSRDVLRPLTDGAGEAVRRRERLPRRERPLPGPDRGSDRRGP